MMVKDKVCKILREDIVLGRLNPGERLIESELTERHGVSRGMIREALTLLCNEGFVTITPNKGAAVSKISSEDLADFYKLLALLERKAVEWATPRMTGADIVELIDINDRLRKSMTSGDDTRVYRWGDLNLSFHRFFWDRCGNDKLGWLVEIIRQRIFRYRFTSLMITSYDHYLKDHAQIIKFVQQHDTHQAGTAMEKHINRAFTVLTEFFTHVTV